MSGQLGTLPQEGFSSNFGTLGVIVWFGRLVLNACGGGRRCGPRLLTLVQCQYYINPCLP